MSSRSASSGTLKPSLKKKAKIVPQIHSNPSKPKFHIEADAPALSAKAKGKARAVTPPPKKQKKASVQVSDPSSSLPTSFKVVFGSYEKLLYGLEGTVYSEGLKYAFDLKPIFIFPAHVSCIKSVSASPEGGKWLATGSDDEIIKVWDLRRRKEIGGLMHHQGSITHLVFPSRSYLLSASEDGTLCLFRARDWAVLRELKGHKGRVNSVAVHKSCKVALSVGKDRTLRMWDLMRGKGSASIKLGKEGELVRWSVDGSIFGVQTQNTIDIYNTDMELLHTVTHPSRIQDIHFCKRIIGEGDLLLVGAEDKKLTIYTVPDDRTQIPAVIAEMVGHSNRVKAVDAIRISLPEGSSRESTTVVCTVSSDGKVRLYDLALVPETSVETIQLDPLAEYDTKGTRLTCVTLADGDQSPSVQGKRKRGNVEESGSEDEAEIELEGEQIGAEAQEEEEGIDGGDSEAE
ncbi:WD40 repeat-like protein [Epithele typhae]|uniref:WD40 repeat-like protein n=1 Tax=Epithele typhae TaxID=378194 RepID=UPI0020079491|nr:WD40 repeat-like protein [Epithele typhae]KAH9940771.1 WD40 repeat-like protein [Epithele typhae]